jgi:hypothetical protein
MPRRRLIIEAGDAGQLVLQIDAGTLTLRGGRNNAEALLQSLRVARIYCELEVEGEPSVPGGSQGPPRPLQAGEVFEVGACQLRVETEPSAPAAEHADEQPAGVKAGPAPEGLAAAAYSPSGTGEPKRLVVIDGADQGKTFRLPLSGTITLGKSRKHAEIVLHDLYVSRLHCQLEVNGDEVVVVDQGALRGTLVNGRQIERQAMRVGEVLRVGNSHLRLELVPPGAADDESEAPAGHEGEGEAFAVAGEKAANGTAPAEKESKPEDMPEAARQLQRLRDELERLSGQMLGYFRVGPVLGRGRYGLVFRADNQKTSQPVALKVLSPLFPQTEAELRHFAQALKGALPLRHPNLVGVQGVGKTGIYTWIVRDYVEGDSVADILRGLPAGHLLDWRLGYLVAVHVARALDFVRGHHLHHGQVTPPNILLRRDGQAALLADLALASALEGSRLTQARLGYRPAAELCFLSPEQAQTEELVDDAADLYTLGAVVYALLTGRPPVQGDTGPKVLEQLLGPPARPAAFPSDVPAPLQKMILRMLARNPEDRYPTAAALLDDLKHVAEKEQVEV